MKIKENLMENKEYFEFDPAYSEFNPLSEEVKKEIQSIIEPERKEDTGLCAMIIRKLMPCKLV